ncbi:MAG TPA: ATP-binding protein, partial [Desulfobacteria bacterium]|nr:ATP-binding protein [Desulfobacteria bacterium]
TKVALTYFKPYLAGDDTTKFIPAFIRLVLFFTIFTIVFSVIVSKINVSLINSDIDKIRNFVSGLIKGSSQSFTGKMNYAEFLEVTEELNSLQAQTLKREELKKRMTADLAHELRTPLTTLQSHLEALIDGIWQPTPQRLNSCHEEIMRLIRLVGDLAKLSKIEDESMILQKSSFDLTELVKVISTNFEGELGQKKISLTINGDEQLINADKDKISQVFVNLLSNSLKYTSRNGKVLIDISGDEQYVTVVLNDSGIGIPEKDLPNVFNRLYRSDSSRTRSTGGAGIGLTIAMAIVEAHRGSIDIVSQEGLGTEITLILPHR